jgi:hypothetical protein
MLYTRTYAVGWKRGLTKLAPASCSTSGFWFSVDCLSVETRRYRAARGFTIRNTEGTVLDQSQVGRTIEIVLERN